MVYNTRSVEEATAYFSQLTTLITKSVESVLHDYAAASRLLPTLECTNSSAVLDTQVIRDAVRVIEGACAQLVASIAPAPHIMANRTLGGVDQACLRVAIKAKIADQLRDGPKSVAELAAGAKVDAGKLGRVLRNLAVKHCFSEVTKDVFANNRLSVCLLSGTNTNALVDFGTDELNTAFVYLPEALTKPEWLGNNGVEQTAYFLAHGQAHFKRYETETWRAERFSRAMIAYTGLQGGTDEIARIYPWPKVSPGTTFCDIGGAVGHVSLALRKMHPHVKVVVQDMASVVEDGHKLWEKEDPHGLAKGDVRLVAINFLENSPVDGCDFYYLKHVLHDWPEADCVTILTNIKKAMIKKKTSKLLIHEFMLHDATQHANHAAAGAILAPPPLLANFGTGAQRRYMMDINMLACYNGAERTLDDFIRIGNAAGLQFSRLWEGGEVTVMEFACA
ncbi:S-adenosyl-L-methionine-dependent methyltransferase [Exidia glandulosa HHB12029]|uniref:S-adenosyl-L-methionine-dependent methyltransferase n=1 Tax=Exidia glandulosa HHB12029 TaxID=1314781 RepID=A0A165GN67_EXIGL|nr:S-adenosyl-L-methionine-dependent methyltransferase [Exidia glandulosa HHB12029]